MATEHFDVLIVGAGLSGIGAGYHLQANCPGKTYAILEGREAIGGTWDLFRYPGIRSDSDMYTLGYSFKPWRQAKAIADGPSILNYVRETAAEHGIDKPDPLRPPRQTRQLVLRDRHLDGRGRARRARPSASAATSSTCAPATTTTRPGYTPDFAGVDTFKGRIVHPQHWPDDVDYAGKKVVVIGSGATAVTLVPEMAKTASHVTMLQRSPTYVVSRPAEDGVANWLRAKLPAMTAYGITRWKNVLMQMLFFNIARKKPEKTKERQLIDLVREHLGPDYDVETHFTPQLQSLGPAPVPGARRRPVRRRSRRARPRWSPTISTPSPRPASN